MSRAARYLLLSLLLVPGFAAASRAQEPGTREIFIGSRVRIFAPNLRSDRYVGRIDSLDTSALVLDTAGARIRLGIDMGPVLVDQFRKVSIPLASINRIEVSGGRTTRGSTIRGMLIGGLAGGFLLGLGNLPEINPGFGDFVKGFPAGAIAGTIIGGTVGFALGGESWLPAMIRR